MTALRVQQGSMRTVTPDQTLSSFAALTPASQFSQPLQPSRPVSSGTNAAPTMGMGSSSMPLRPAQPATMPGGNMMGNGSGGAGIDWSAATRQQQPVTMNGFGATSRGFGLPPPPMSPPAQSVRQQTAFPGVNGPALPQQQQQKSGLDKYESLI